MVPRRPSPVDTPDATTKNSVLHYVGLAGICVALVVIFVVLLT